MCPMKLEMWKEVTFHNIVIGIKERDIISVLGRDKGYTVKYNPLPEGVPEGKAQENS